MTIHRMYQALCCSNPHLGWRVLLLNTAAVEGVHTGRVQQDVHKMVIQQVDLVHVQNAPVGLRQKARLEGLHTCIVPYAFSSTQQMPSDPADGSCWMRSSQRGLMPQRESTEEGAAPHCRENAERCSAVLGGCMGNTE